MKNVTTTESEASFFARYVRIIVRVVVEVSSDSHFALTLTKLAIIWHQLESYDTVRILLKIQIS